MNCIFLIIDSLSYSRCQQSKIDLLPNLNRRARNGIRCENMYAQAPYTEAATMALYCGQRTLTNHGYIERFNNADKTLMEVVQEAGYEVFFNSFQPQCFPSSLRRGIDHIFYNRGYDVEALWNYRFSYYAEKSEKVGLVANDYWQLRRILDDNFSEWLRFLEDVISEHESVKMIKSLNRQFDAKAVREEVRVQREIYEKNKNEYIDQILTRKEEHPLFRIAYFKQMDYSISPETEKVYTENAGALCKKIRLLNFIENLLFNRDIYAGGIKAYAAYLKNHDKKELNHRLYIIRNALIMCNLMKKYGGQGHSLKGQPSFDAHIKNFLSWLDDREGKTNRPYFACMHVDDIHFPEMFYTYDTDDKELLKKELDVAESYLSRRKFHSKGTISLDLSLLYADSKCEYLFEELEKRNAMEDTMIFVTADHGFSYSGYPIRDKLINTFYLENFKIPFYAFGTGIKAKKIKKLSSSLDIPPTICSLLGIDLPLSFEGTPLLATTEELQMIEYCGGGCPDINDRQLMIAAFDKEYMVASLVRLEDVFSKKNVTEVYDLRDDPEQRKNLVHKIDFNIVNKYMEAIQNRLVEIRRTNHIYQSR